MARTRREAEAGIIGCEVVCRVTQLRGLLFSSAGSGDSALPATCHDSLRRTPIGRPSRYVVPAAALFVVLATALGTPAVGLSQSTVRVVAYNIKHGRGMDDTLDLRRIADVLRRLDADVIALQEVDNGTARTAGVDQVAALARLLGYEGFHGAHRRYQGGAYGNAILTRLPVHRVRTHAIPPASGSALSVHEIELVVGGSPSDPDNTEADRTISVVSVHLAGTPDERLAQADSVTRFFTDVPRPVVLAGDFNGRPDSPVLQRLRRDWLVLEKSGDAQTYPSPTPDREIDFIMLRPEPRVEVVEHRVIDERLASDHRPLLAVLRVH